MTSGGSESKATQASSRLRNSGLKVCSMALRALPGADPLRAEPQLRAESSCAPALVVRMRTMWRKSALRPLLSVSVAWSITCSRML